MMRRLAVAIGAAASLMATTSPAQAGVYTDDLSKCLVKSAGEADQKTLIFWIFMSMSRHPSVTGYTNLTDKQRDDGDRAGAAVFERLMLQDCRREMVTALKYEGPGAIEPAFTVLGQVAMRGLLSDPTVAQGMTGLSKHVDAKQFEALGKEAGLPPAPSK